MFNHLYEDQLFAKYSIEMFKHNFPYVIRLVIAVRHIKLGHMKMTKNVNLDVTSI